MPLPDWLNLRRLVQSDSASAVSMKNYAESLAAKGADEYDRGSRSCEHLLLKAADAFQKLGDDEQLARVAMALGRAYLHIRGLRDLGKAAKWYAVAAENARNASTVAQALGSLAILEQQIFDERVQAGIPAASLGAHLEKAEQLHRQALQTFSGTDHVMRGVTEGMLAQVLAQMGNIQEAERHQQRAIREHTMGGDPERAASARLNLSSLMIQAGRLHDALLSVTCSIETFEEIPPDQRSVDWKQRVDAAREQRDSIARYLGWRR